MPAERRTGSRNAFIRSNMAVLPRDSRALIDSGIAGRDSSRTPTNAPAASWIRW